MSNRLSRAQRESIIIDFINGKETPGFEVKENASNGKFIVKRIKVDPIPEVKNRVIEIEEEDINEENDKVQSDDEYESLTKPIKIRSKQNARELLRELSQLLNDEDEDPQKGQYIEKRYNPGPQSWKRRKLIL